MAQGNHVCAQLCKNSWSELWWMFTMYSLGNNFTVCLNFLFQISLNWGIVYGPWQFTVFPQSASYYEQWGLTWIHSFLPTVFFFFTLEISVFVFFLCAVPAGLKWAGLCWKKAMSYNAVHQLDFNNIWIRIWWQLVGCLVSDQTTPTQSRWSRLSRFF